ncbi:hypothetical protein MBLNU230_g2395t1 [Neophaeotheca triangularis]
MPKRKLPSLSPFQPINPHKAPKTTPAISSPTTPSDHLINSLTALSADAFTAAYIPAKLLTYAPSATTNPTPHQNTSYTITLHTGPSLSNPDFAACFNLISRTSRKDYETSSLGWKPRAKTREMREPGMRYLIARTDPTTTTTTNTAPEPSIAAFASFLPTHDSAPPTPVLYLYELHSRPEDRGRGLGRHLVEIVKAVARGTGVEGSMLTCFTGNEVARGFYRKAGFGVDVTSPRERRVRGRVVRGEYEILGWQKMDT